LNYRAFTLRFYTENIFKIKIQKTREKDYSNFKNDILIINTIENTIDDDTKLNTLKYIEDLKKFSNDSKLQCEVIYKKQTSTEFSDFFLAYRMKLLIIVKLDETNKNVSFQFIN
jgi:hypothetical protein